MQSSYKSPRFSVSDSHSPSIQTSRVNSDRLISDCKEPISDSVESVSQESLIIELDAITKAKTVSASAICEPGFLLIVTAGAGAETGASSSPMNGRWKQFTDEF